MTVYDRSYTMVGDQTHRMKALTEWVRSAMRFIDLADADPTDYADRDLHEDAEKLTIDGYMLFGADAMFDAWSLAELESRELTAFYPDQKDEPLLCAGCLSEISEAEDDG